jgi:hypothetical protein
MFVLWGSTNPLTNADAEQVAGARRLILNGIKGLPGVVRLYSVSEIARNHRLHDHWLMASDCKLAISRVKAIIRQSWRAVGVETRTKAEAPRDFAAVSNYMHKNLRDVREGKRFVRLFAKGTVDMVWGSRGPRAFFLKGDKARHWLGYRNERFGGLGRVRPRLRVVRVA